MIKASTPLCACIVFMASLCATSTRAYEVIDDSGSAFSNDEIRAIFRSLDSENLRDPDSAKIRKLRKVDDLICGEINAKNAYGGYVGYRMFIINQHGIANFYTADGKGLSLSFMREKCTPLEDLLRPIIEERKKR